jgi:hypothetical protein
MGLGYYLNQICFGRLLEDDSRLSCTCLGKLIMKFLGENHKADNILMFDFADYADIYLD